MSATDEVQVELLTQITCKKHISHMNLTSPSSPPPLKKILLFKSPIGPDVSIPYYPWLQPRQINCTYIPIRWHCHYHHAQTDVTKQGIWQWEDTTAPQTTEELLRADFRGGRETRKTLSLVWIEELPNSAWLSLASALRSVPKSSACSRAWDKIKLGAWEELKSAMKRCHGRAGKG